MGKKKGNLKLLYLVGMALVAIGFCCPLFFRKIGKTIKAGKTTGFNFINFDANTLLAIAALMIFVGAVLGVLLCFLKFKKVNMCKALALIISIVGGVLVVINYNDSALAQAMGKGFLKHAFVGLYMIVAGWVIAIIGLIQK